MDITEQVSEAKKELRRTLAALRMEQLAALDAAAGEALWAKVEALPEFISAGTVLLYSALPDEIPTEGVLRRWSGCFLQEDGDADGQAKAGAVSFNVFSPQGKLIPPYDVGTLLDRQGVAVRTGHHCAEPLIDYLGVPGTVRASFAMYNTREEVDVFIAALKKAIMMLQ